MLDPLNRYRPLIVVNGLAAIGFMIGNVLFGIPWPGLDDPRLAGRLVAVDGPLHLLGFGLPQLVTRRCGRSPSSAPSASARWLATGWGAPGRSEPASV